jgi:hypothetical protein
MFSEHIEDGKFNAKEIHVDSARMMIPELARWANALKVMRKKD